MSYSSLIPELEDVIQQGSPERRAETLKRITAFFLDGASRPLDELAIMRSTPMPAMLRATIEDATERGRRRIMTTLSSG